MGIELARGQSLKDILAGTRMVAEGVRTTEAALALGARHDIELPIAREMSDVLAGRTRSATRHPQPDGAQTEAGTRVSRQQARVQKAIKDIQYGFV